MHELGALFTSSPQLSSLLLAAVLMIVTALGFIPAGSALASCVSAFVDFVAHNVVVCQRMAAKTGVRSVSNHLRMRAAIQVDSVRGWLKVIRSYAPPVPAEVVERQVVRHWPGQFPISISVGTVVLPIRKQIPVAVRNRALPNPTGSFVSASLNHVIDAFSQLMSRHVRPPPRLRYDNYNMLFRPNKWVPWTWVDERALREKE